jgi:hypothetical protein
MNIRKRFRLLINVVAMVALLVLAKVLIHNFGFEFLETDIFFPSVVASSIFIIGFLLSSILPDYKESERMPAEIRTALEAIYDDADSFARRTPNVDMDGLRKILTGFVVALENGLDAKHNHSGLAGAIGEVDRLSAAFTQMEQLGMSPNFIVRLRGGQDVLRKCVYRIYYVQKMQFLPSVHVLIQTLVVATIFLLLFLQTEGSYGSAFVFGFVSYMFIYALHLIKVLEQPFRKHEHSVDDVSFFLLREFVDKIGRAETAASQHAATDTRATVQVLQSGARPR